ncbi:MAG: condensation domain-containing protein, partial [Psychrosphaera sp.]|nr:condensation domain-containing protein [Psychrosphaera sp.]
LRAIPNNGIGFGAFCQKGALDNPLPAINFNYLGQFDSSPTATADWQLTDEDCGTLSGEGNDDNLLLNIHGAVKGGVLSFEVISGLNTDVANVFKAALVAVIDTAVEAANKGGIHTPNDYGVKNLSITHLEHLQSCYYSAQGCDIEAIYPANSLQQGFVYHHQKLPNDDAYRVQILLDYHQKLDVAAYQQAWHLASIRYPALRTAFDWQDDVIQIISKQASITKDNFRFVDLTHLAQNEHFLSLADILRQDLNLQFDLSKPGLIRLTIIKQNDNLYTVLKNEHHSIGDGWSGSVLLDCVHNYYQTLLDGRTPIIELDTAYLAAQQYTLDHGVENDAYWAQQEFGYANDINLMLSKPIDLSQTRVVDQPASANISLSTGALKQMCKAQGVTLNVALQFAWHKLLQSYTQDEQTIVGATVSGRDIPVDGIESSVGLFINTLPLVVDWSANAATAEVLHSIQQNIAALNIHSGFSFASLQKQGKRLFHSYVVFENYPVPTDDEGLNSKISLRDGIEKSDYPLGLAAHEQGDSLFIRLDYGKAWLDAAQAERLLNQLQLILQQISIDAQQPHQAISLLDEQDAKSLHRWNETSVEFAQPASLAQLFETQVSQSPNAIALVSDGQKLSYQQLNEQANQLAHLLPADALIGLYLDRSVDMVVSILAVLKAGSAYVPISPDYPRARTEFIVNDTNAPLIITEQKYQSKLAGFNTLLGDTLSKETRNKTNNPKVEVSVNDLAYVIYTSGTTGTPKGVMIEQQNVVHYLNVLQHQMGDRFTNVDFSSNYCFDLSVTTSLCPLLLGQTIYLYTGDITDVSAYQQHLNDNPIAFIKTTPGLAQLLLPGVVKSIRTLMLGGELLTQKCIDSLADKVEFIFDEYGPTETTVGAMLAQVYPAKPV